MRHHWLQALGLLLCSPITPAVTAQTADETAIRRVIEADAELAQAHDLAALDTLFAHDAWVRIIEGAGVNEGWVDYRDHHLGPELAAFTNFRLRYYDIEVQVRGSVAWSAFRYDVAADTPRGPLDSQGRGTAVLEKRDGRWVIVHRHTSGRPRQPAR